MRETVFHRQALLLLRCLPAVAAEPLFALKGGTAINLFVRDFPRLSVDIDLVYLPRQPREESLQEIEEALLRLDAAMPRQVPGLQVLGMGNESAPKRVVGTAEARIKIEPNPVLRGTVYEPVLLAELLAGSRPDMRALYEREFAGMARVEVGLDTLEAVRSRVPAMLLDGLTQDERAFLLSIKRGEPEWDRLPVPGLDALPALNWKLANIEKLRTSPGKHQAAVDALRRVLGI